MKDSGVSSSCGDNDEVDANLVVCSDRHFNVYYYENMA